MFKKFLDPDGSPFELDIQATEPGFVCRVSNPAASENPAGPNSGGSGESLQFADFQLLGPDTFVFRTATGERKAGRYHIAGDIYFLQIDGETYRFRRARAAGSGSASSGAHHTPMPGKVLAVYVAVGDTVEPDQALVVVEAMKMENAIRAAICGEVTAVRCQAGDIVGPDDVLVEVASAGN